MHKKTPSEHDKAQAEAFELGKFATFYSESFPFLLYNSFMLFTPWFIASRWLCKYISLCHATPLIWAG